MGESDAGYVTTLRPRWSDMDVFGHINHANMVTLLEEARVPLLFADASAAGLTELAEGIVVAHLAVDYRCPIVVDGHDIRVQITLSELRFASFTLRYAVHDGPAATDTIAVRAETVLAPYDVASGRPRRLHDDERVFLRRTLAGTGDG